MQKIKQAIGIKLFESDNFGGPKIEVVVFAQLKEQTRLVVE